MGDATKKIFTTHGLHLIYRHGFIWSIQFFMLYLAHIMTKEKVASVSESIWLWLGNRWAPHTNSS